jgi:hypothetical protein
MRSDIDFTFRLSWQARALLTTIEAFAQMTEVTPGHLLEDLEGIVVRTFPMYNGREHGITLVVEALAPGSLLINFGEHRRSDSLFVWVQEMVHGPDMNGPTHSDFSEASYRNRDPRSDVGHRLDFPEGAFVPAATHIFKVIGQFYTRQAAKRAELDKAKTA